MSGAGLINDADRYRHAVALIDQRNAEDQGGREPEHAGAVVRWIEALRPDASEALLLAGRAQHMGRWRTPRDSYPSGRAGYLRWRRDLQVLHAREAAHILTECGYPAPFIDRVGAIMRKERLREDPETQTLEDALCLVFIERELEAFRQQHDQAKLERILRRTWAKMSEPGRQAALGLALPRAVADLLAQSLPSY